MFWRIAGQSVMLKGQAAKKGKALGSGEITKEIERFIQDHIDSVEKLKTLFLLADEPQKDWSAAQVSQKLYRQPDSVAIAFLLILMAIINSYSSKVRWL